MCVLRGQLGAACGISKRRSPPVQKLELPLVADEQHRLRQVQRGKTSIDRKGDDPVGERDLLVPAGRSARGRSPDLRPRRRCRHGPRSSAAASTGATTAGLVVGRGDRGGRSGGQVGDRLLDGVEQLGLLQNLVTQPRPAAPRCSAASRGLTIQLRKHQGPSRARPCRYSRRAAAGTRTIGKVGGTVGLCVAVRTCVTSLST